MPSRRALVVSLVSILFACAAPGLAAPPASAAAPELRGLWVVRTALVSPEAVDRVVDEAAAAGFNALFVQVRGRGDAFYRSAIAPRSPLLERQPRDFDPFARLLLRAHQRRLQVHAWLNVLLTAHFGQPLPRGHVLERHADWVMVPRSVAAQALGATGAGRLRLVMEAGRSDGDVEGQYLSPSVPAVADHLERVVRELVRGYAIDGLHLDFVRYPGPEYDYSRAALEGFRRRSGGGDLLGAPARDPAGWDEYRRNVLTVLTTRLADAGRAERPGIVVSAAVTPDRALAVAHKFQDWPAWLQSGVLSAVCPMAYTPDSRLFQQQLEDVRQQAAGQLVWAGIGAYRLDPAGLVEKIALARQTGANGVVLFSNESLDAGHLRRLRDESFVSGAAQAEARPGRASGAR
jgi:uncharacterized lipoprotein YddW (UPF0748 family)